MSSLEEHVLTKEQLEIIKKLRKEGDITREAYQDYAIKTLIELHKPDGESPPPPTDCDRFERKDPETGKCLGPILPVDGREQFHKGASKNPDDWKVVTMNDDPSLYKIVDNDGVNVADRFATEQNAEMFIIYYMWLRMKEAKCAEEGKQFDPVKNECIEKKEPPPGQSTTKDGVTIPFKVKEFKYDNNDRGTRYDFKHGSGTSMVMIGYFKTSGNDDVSAKILGGRHSDSAKYDGCCYIPAIETDSGEPKFRVECPHPDYGSVDLDFEQKGKSYNDGYVGTMAVAIQESNGVRIQMWQDQGNNDGDRPANEWVKILEMFDDGNKASGIDGADRFPLRKLPDSAQNTWRIDTDNDAKWLAVGELDV